MSKAQSFSMHRRLSLILIPALFFITLKTHRTFSGSGDEPHYILIAESLYDDHDLDLRNQYPDRHPFIPQLTVKDAHAVRTPDGAFFPSHDIGLPVLMLPTLTLVHFVVPRIPASWLRAMRLSPEKLTITFFSYQSIAVTCLLALLLYGYFLRWRLSPRVALAGALAAVLSPPLLTYATLFFTEIYSACFVVLAATLLEEKSETRSTSLMTLAVFGLAWLHIKNEILAGLLGALWFTHTGRINPQRRWTQGLWPLASFLLALILRAWLLFHALGVLNPQAARSAGPLPFHLSLIPSNLLGMLFDREFGLLFVNPLFFLLPAAFYLCWKEDRGRMVTTGLLILGTSLSFVAFSIWWAGWCPAGRHCLPFVPLLWAPLLRGIEKTVRSAHRFFRWSVGLLAAMTFFVSLTFWQCPLSSWSFGDGNNRWMSRLSFQGLEWQTLFPSFFSHSSSLLGWLGFALVFNLWALRVFLDRAGEPSPS